MQTSTRLLALISAQQSLLISKDNQTERLSAELKRLEKSNQPYYIAVGVKVALKLLDVANEAGWQIADSLEYAGEKTLQNQKMEGQNLTESGREALRESQRKMQVRIMASSLMQNLHTALANRASENLCQAHLLVVGAADNDGQSGYLPTVELLSSEIDELNNLAYSYAQDVDFYGEHIEKNEAILSGDAYEMKSQKEVLRQVKDLVDVHIDNALQMMTIVRSGLKFARLQGAELSQEQIITYAANAIVAASLTRYAAQLLQETICSLGSVKIVARITSDRLKDNELMASLKGLTGQSADYHLN